MSKTGWFFRIAFIQVLALLFGYASHFQCQAQSLIDEVHINPLTEPAKIGPMGAFAPHDRPIKVNVDLVLVPVTISDDHERLYVGLHEKNFEVFEGKNRQEI